LQSRGLVACRFDDLTVDTPRNRLVRAALEALSGLVSRKPDLAHRCLALARGMAAQGVAATTPTRAQMSVERFGRNDWDDKEMVDAARLALELALPNEDAGQAALPLPDREGTWVRSLFEKAVGGFYATVLPRDGWTVQRSRAQEWPVSSNTQRIPEILPRMVCDIVLERPSADRRIVIDTKFTSVVTKGWYREETLRSAYLYQIYAYLRSQVGGTDQMADNASGVLLHPSVGDAVDETAVIQGHAIRFATVDLTAPTHEIRAQLLRICHT
jgi:5-methylcytosine-specific restriction enzyme subunit McrC